MPTSRYRTLDGKEEVDSVASRLSEIIAIYPISPASPTREYADDWSAMKRPNLWGAVPEIITRQLEAGRDVRGLMYGKSKLP